MIQRIQSIFLLLVTISLFSTFFFPLSEKIVYTNENNRIAIKEKEEDKQVENGFYLMNQVLRQKEWVRDL